MTIVFTFWMLSQSVLVHHASAVRCRQGSARMSNVSDERLQNDTGIAALLDDADCEVQGAAAIAPLCGRLPADS